jgi:hypothetical protein|tara:strand:- start:1350 stop:1529 length:180 start_codon:yes stop_codon:yes gene_type:complete
MDSNKIDFTKDSEYIRIFGSIKERMLKANKARTDLLSDNPEINSKWTPNAIELMKKKEE